MAVSGGIEALPSDVAALRKLAHEDLGSHRALVLQIDTTLRAIS